MAYLAFKEARLRAAPDDASTKLVALAISLACHILLLWFLLPALGIGGDDGMADGRDAGATLINLDGLQSDRAIMTPANRVSKAPPLPLSPSAETTLVETSNASSLHPQWTASSKLVLSAKAEIALPQIIPAFSPSGTSDAGNPNSRARQTGGGLGYDPYAGGDTAAGGSIAETGEGGADQFTLNRQALASSILAARRRAGTLHGTMHLKVRVTFEGIVIGVTPLGGTLDTAGEKIIAQALLGHKLFAPPHRAQAMVEIELPEILL